MTKMTLAPGKIGLADLIRIDRERQAIALTSEARSAVAASAARVAALVEHGKPVYGINTGFGKNANVSIAPQQTALLQRNLILSHASGVGPPTPDRIVHLMMALKIASLGRGASGVRPETIALLESMIEHGIYPIVPVQGSVGASGDLAPLAHMTLAMLGEGEVRQDGTHEPATDALGTAGLAPVALAAKEGLGLINGTQFSTAYALCGLIDAYRLAMTALATGALATDALMGSTTPFEAEIHALRGHAGQMAAAATLRSLLDGSEIRAWHVDDDNRIQDPYSFRCMPQVMGACLDLLEQAARTLVIEANAVTDNPLLLSSGECVSGGNFHAEPVAFAADQIALALAEIGTLAQRRVALLVDTNFSNGLPSFLSGGEPGLNSGFMVPEIAAAALAAENRQRAMPCSIDSTPTSAAQEDHVSMAAHGARRLADMTDNLARILAIELVAAAQGVSLRQQGRGHKRFQPAGKLEEVRNLPEGLATSAPLERIMALVRKEAGIAMLGDDRSLSADLARAETLIASGRLIAAAGPSFFPPLAGAAEAASFADDHLISYSRQQPRLQYR